MPFWKFSALTLAGCVPWGFMLTLIGQKAGERWEDWKNNLHYVDDAVAGLILLGALYLAVRWWRNRRPAADVAA
jgi:membrane protein DedA with SNARE-associated domain